eukprot:1160803-Pelagomonas_calceolata.AAC.18
MQWCTQTPLFMNLSRRLWSHMSAPGASPLQAPNLDPWSLSPQLVFKAISATGMRALTHFQRSAACRASLECKPGVVPQGIETGGRIKSVNLELREQGEA